MIIAFSKLVSFSGNKTLFIILFFLLLPADILADTIKIGAYENPPKVYTGRSGDISGIFPDILEVIAREEGWNIAYSQGTWEQCLERLESGEIDIMIDIASSQKRSEKYLFSKESVILNWGTFYTKEDFIAESFLDLQGKKVAVVKEDIHTTGENGIIELAGKFDLELQYIEVESYEQAMLAVQNGRADVAVVNRLYGSINEDTFKLQSSPIVFNPVQLKFAFNKTKHADDLINTIDHHIKELKHDPDSIFHKILNSYLAGTEYDLSSYYKIKPIFLTEEEQNWLKEHKTIRLGVDPSYAPYSFVNQNGEYNGVALDIINFIAPYLDLKIEIVKGLSWPEILDAAKNKSIDAILTTVKTEERLEYLVFTETYLSTPLVIMEREGVDSIEGPEDLTGKRVALVKGYTSTDKVQREHPEIIPVLVDTPIEGLAAVSVGEVDCYVGVLGVNDYLVREHGISNLRIAARYDMLLFGQGIGVRKDWKILATIFNKALQAISEKKKLHFFQSWISSKANLEGAAALQEEYALTAEETDWVKKNQNIKLGADPEFAPFEFFDKKGEYHGIVAEYINILNQRLGLRMEVVPGLTWKDAIQHAKEKRLDALPCIGKTEERESFFNFSTPYLNYSRIIITRSDMPFIRSIDDIEKLSVAVQKGSSHEGYLRENTKIKAAAYATLVDSLKAVSEGKADALVGNLASCIYWIRKEHLTNLKVAGPVTYSSESLYFATRNDWPIFTKIINKGLSSISPAKEKRIKEKWINVEYEPGVDPKIITTYVLKGLAAAAIVILLFTTWNFILRKEIQRRKRVECDLQFRLDFEERLFEAATQFITMKYSDLEIEIPKALNRLLTHLQAEAGYLFSLSKTDKNTMVLTHFWDQDKTGTETTINHNCCYKRFPFFEKLQQGEIITCQNPEEIITDTQCRKVIQNTIGLSPMTVLPISFGESLAGLLWIRFNKTGNSLDENTFVLLKAIGFIFGSTLQRITMEQEITAYQNELETRIQNRTQVLSDTNNHLLKEIAVREQAEKEKENLQDQLLQAQKMESIGTLAGGIAHDFNNILSAILGFTEVAHRQVDRNSEISQYLSHVLESGERAKSLVQQILTFSRQANSAPTIVAPLEILEESLRMLRPTLPATIKIIQNFDDISSYIYIDPTQLNQIIMNLCTNAFHAMEEQGGILTLSLNEKTETDNHSSATFIHLTISDTGPGIPETIANKVFDPFFTTKEVGKGSGMGLSIVHGIVTKIGGKIHFETGQNEGTTFHILFPAHQPEEEIKDSEKPGKLGAGEHILFVDDEELIVKMSREMLLSLGYRVTTAENGLHAIEIFKQMPDQFDLVMTDQTMSGGITGVELSKQLLAIRTDLPIILCTGYSSLVDKEKAQKAGIKAFALKPIGLTELSEILHKSLL